MLAYDAATGRPQVVGRQGHARLQLAAARHDRRRGASADGVSDHGLEAFDPATGKRCGNTSGTCRACSASASRTSSRASKCWSARAWATARGCSPSPRTAKRGQATEEWISKDLKPYFNDFVERDGYLYGFDGNIFVCMDLATGKRKWKKGR